jgi:hypothetical protein
MRQTRAAGYAALELYSWLQYAESRRDARRFRQEYQRIARNTARQPCPNPCPNGDWNYYERLESPRYVGSGRFDAVPGGAIDPETADSTYNGEVWLLARELYFGDQSELPPSDARYQSALAYYQRNAYTEPFAWSWRNGQAQLAEYRLAIARRNSADQSATNALGVVIANRVLSLVDAFVTVRVRSLGAGRPAEFSARVPWHRVRDVVRRPR